MYEVVVLSAKLTCTADLKCEASASKEKGGASASKNNEASTSILNYEDSTSKSYLQLLPVRGEEI